MITYFTARLRCPRCGQESEAEFYTKLLDEPGTVVLRVGDAVDADPVDYEKAFLQLRECRPDEPFRILLPWKCWPCGWGNWALVTIAEGKVESIEALPLNRGTLPLAQFIVYDLNDWFETVTGEGLYEPDDRGGFRLRDDFAALLAAHLPDPPEHAPSYESFY